MDTFFCDMVVTSVKLAIFGLVDLKSDNAWLGKAHVGVLEIRALAFRQDSLAGSVQWVYSSKRLEDPL